MPPKHPAFVNMADKHLAGCVVLRRLPNVNGNARWRVRADCGHEFAVDGIRLRQLAKEGQRVCCRECKPTRSADV